jgi:phosphotransacetylase
MMIKSFNDLVKNVQAMTQKTRVAVIAAQDVHTLEAVVNAKKKNLIVPILIGDPVEITGIIKALPDNPADYEIVPAQDVDACLEMGIQMVHNKQVDAIMKGRLETGQIMKAIVNKENKLRRGGLLSLIGFFETKQYHKLFAVSDVGLNTYPDLSGKKDILVNAVHVLHAMGMANPKVAALAAVEKLNMKMPETIDADALQKMNENEEITGCIVAGPIAFDLATSKEAARIKGYQSEVAGDADLLLVPDIVSGNILAKCLTGFAGATTAGLVIGAKVPIILTSRSAEASDKYYSIALAAYTSQSY